MLHFELVDETKGESNITRINNKYIINYPCIESHDCTEYHSLLPPGVYHIELYGASGGGKYISTTRTIDQLDCENQDDVLQYDGNTECINITSIAGAGGYTSGILTLREYTKVYIAIGGSGVYT